MAAFYTFDDLSGSKDPVNNDNPYQSLLDACNNDPSQIQARYATHRDTRNAQQRFKLLAPDFPGVTVDEILANGLPDWRHCLVFWARPPLWIRNLIGEIQQKLRDIAPKLWLMRPQDLHMTALEIVHSRTEAEVDALVEKMMPGVEEMVNWTQTHRAKLGRPVLSFDAQALALSFLPLDGEGGYTYHHLRRDLHARASETGVEVASRYVIPSAHLTIARFVTQEDFEGEGGKVDGEKMESWVRAIEEVNQWLEREYWGEEGEWIVGQEKRLDFRKGTLWYGGGGETVRIGKGF